MLPSGYIIQYSLQVEPAAAAAWAERLANYMEGHDLKGKVKPSLLDSPGRWRDVLQGSVFSCINENFRSVLWIIHSDDETEAERASQRF